jgi:hypothetical protein
MTCRSARRQMADLFDDAAVSASAELHAHLEVCGACAAEFAGARNALASVTPVERVRASLDFKERTMNKLHQELNAAPAARPRLWARPIPRLAFSVGLVLAIVLALPYFGGNHSQSGAIALLAQSVQAMSSLQTVHITARMRTLPRDNFEMIGLNYDFVPVEMWKEFGTPQKWRIEKPGRVVAMDGAGSLLLIGGNQAMRGGARTGFVDWLMPLLDPDRVLQSELLSARQGKSQATLTNPTDRASHETMLRVARRAEGDLTNDWLRNKSVLESDHTCVYRFDAPTNRLAGLQVLVHSGGQDVPVFEITNIVYNEPLSADLFTPALPADVSWMGTPADLPVTGAIPATPREAALAFFEGCANRDWQRVASVTQLSDGLKQDYGGIQVVSVGEAFQSGTYRGWFVPYEIRYPGGQTKKHNLAVRNDNPQKRFILDGGF